MVLRRLVLPLALGPAAIAALAAPAPAAFAPGAQTAGDALFPFAGNGGYDAEHYAVALRYAPATRRLRARATMTATATQDLSRFSLDLQGYRVRSVTVDGARARFARRRPPGWPHRSKLVVTPRDGIRAGARFAVAVRYAGVPRPVVDPDGSWEGFVPTDSGAVVLGEPVGTMGWLPCNNTPADKATFDATITVPRGLWGISNGRLLSRRTRGAWTTHRWRAAQPMAPYLATATIGRYRVTRARTRGGVPLFNAVDVAANTNRRAWGDHPEGAPLPAITPDLVAQLRRDLREQSPAIGLFSRLYGGYPFETAGSIVANAGYIGYALEVQTKPVYVDQRVTALVHELAHQWWGDAVGVSRWQDLWLAEGFAVYSEWLYDRRVARTGPSTERRFARLYRTSEHDDRGRLRPLWKPAIPRRAEDLFGEAVYDRGAMTVEGLRLLVGDRAFWRILRTWQTERRYGTGTTRDLEALAERVSGLELTPFFDAWLRRRGRPQLDPRRYRAAPLAAERSEPNARRSASRSPITRGQTRLAR